MKVRVDTKKDDGTVITPTIQGNVIKMTFGKSFEVPLDFDLRTNGRFNCKARIKFFRKGDFVWRRYRSNINISDKLSDISL